MMLTQGLIVGALTLVVACSSSDATCSCFPSSFALNASSVAFREAKPSDEACVDADVTCMQGSLSASGCSKLVVLARRAGACSVDVTFVDGATRKQSVTLEADGGCCGGFVSVDGNSTNSL